MKRYCAIVLLTSILLSGSGCSRDPQVRRAKFVASGNRYFDQGKFAEAAIEFRSALQADPTSADAH